MHATWNFGLFSISSSCIIDTRNFYFNLFIFFVTDFFVCRGDWMKIKQEYFYHRLVIFPGMYAY